MAEKAQKAQSGGTAEADKVPVKIEYKAPGKLKVGTPLAEILKQATEDVAAMEADEATAKAFYEHRGEVSDPVEPDELVDAR